VKREGEKRRGERKKGREGREEKLKAP